MFGRTHRKTTHHKGGVRIEHHEIHRIEHHPAKHGATHHAAHRRRRRAPMGY